MIKLQEITKKYGENTLFENFSAELSQESVTCLLGASGLGKTTLLNIIAGLTAPDGGGVIFEGFSENRPACSYVFQEHRLLPWLSVYDNLALVLKNTKKPDGSRFSRTEQRDLIFRQLALVGLEGYEKHPIQALSGGMLQRVSLCRAFLYPAEILLLDEPFKALDSKLREGLYEAFFRAYENQTLRRSVVLVTHDIPEALRLSDRLLVLSGAPAQIVGSFEKEQFTPGLEEKIKTLL